MPQLSVIERRTDVMLHRAIQALAAKRKQDRENIKNKLNELHSPGQRPRPEPEMEELDPPAQPHAQPKQAPPERTQHPTPNTYNL